MMFNGFTLEHPWWLTSLLIIPLWMFIQRRRRRDLYPSIRVSDLEIMQAAMRSSRQIWPGIVKALFFSAFAFLAIAMARPQIPSNRKGNETRGIDIILAMDISVSMLARDFSPDRLEASKAVAARFIHERGPDRIGIVIFSGQSFTLCPLTADKAALVTLLQQAQAGFIEDGSTAIGDGIATAINRLRDSDARSKVIILLTDGENNAGNIDPIEAAEIAALFGIRLYTIGVGSRGTAIGPVRIIEGNIIFGPVTVDIDEGTLKKAAEIAGGMYFRAIDENALLDIYREIDKLEKSRLDTGKKFAKMELFPWFLFAGLITMFAAWLIRFVFIRTIP
ncbi:MAG: VWA domain-containing protein [Bacteroidales bacterium]